MYSKGAGLVLSMRVMSVCVHHAVPVSSGLAGRAGGSRRGRPMPCCLMAAGLSDPAVWCMHLPMWQWRIPHERRCQALRALCVCASSSLPLSSVVWSALSDP